MDKHAKLLELSKKRQRSRWEGYNCIGDYHDGVYECDFVSPYTRTAGNVNAEIFVLLQDWSSDESMKLNVDEQTLCLGHTPGLPTNRNLVRLLKEHFNLGLSDIYGTNLFPFIKPGGMSAPIPQKDLVLAAQAFGLPQVKIVSPKLVICLGIATFQALQIACDHCPSKNLEDAIGSTFEHESSQIWCQAHTGRLGQNNRNRGGEKRVTKDWRMMREAFVGRRAEVIAAV